VDQEGVRGDRYLLLLQIFVLGSDFVGLRP
jgi:hypothetical protein